MTQSALPDIRPEDTLGNLATTRAGASRVFARHGLDFCCGGHVTLADVCRKKRLDVTELIREILAEDARNSDFERWDRRPIPELVDHIVERYHEPLLDELGRLVAMAQRVEKVHGEKPTCPRGLAELLDQLRADLDQHLSKEEQILFPALLSGAAGDFRATIQGLETEHEDVGELLMRIRELTSDHTPPSEACGTWRALFLGLAEAERELMEHIHLENHVLFPRACAAEPR